MTGPSSAIRWLVVTAAVVVTPLLHGLAFPLARLHALAWVSLVPWFVALRLVSPARGLALSVLVTLTGTYLVSGWLPRAVATYYEQPAALGVLLYAGAYAVTLAPWFVAFSACHRAVGRRSASAVPLLVAAAWVGAELVRVRLGNPFGLFGYSQAAVLPVIQIADLTGVYGVTFVLVAVNAALAELAVALLGAGRPVREALVGVVTAAILTLLVLGYGVLAMRPRADADGRVTPVAVAQANLDLGAQWRQELYGRNLEEYMRLTVQTLRTTRPPALVVWPESSMTFFLEDEPLYRRALGVLLAAGGTELVAGGVRALRDGEPRYYNSAYLVAPSGEVRARYDKERLLPFAEYFPFGGLQLLRREFGRVREFTPGDAGPPLPTVAGPAGVVICNEAMFPEIVRRRVRDGAHWLVNLSNDSWLGDAQFSAEAVDMSRLRAVEQRRWVVRASTSGPSAIIDPVGRITVDSAPFSRATLAGSIAARDGLSVYGQVGDVFAVACVLAAFAAALRR